MRFRRPWPERRRPRNWCPSCRRSHHSCSGKCCVKMITKKARNQRRKGGKRLGSLPGLAFRHVLSCVIAGTALEAFAWLQVSFQNNARKIDPPHLPIRAEPSGGVARAAVGEVVASDEQLRSTGEVRVLMSERYAARVSFLYCLQGNKTCASSDLVRSAGWNGLTESTYIPLAVGPDWTRRAKSLAKQ